MIIQGSHLTALDAAKKYARAYDGGRAVGTVLKPPHVGAGILFQFVGGVRWYAVTMLPDYSGWNVGPETKHEVSK